MVAPRVSSSSSSSDLLHFRPTTTSTSFRTFSGGGGSAIRAADDGGSGIGSREMQLMASTTILDPSQLAPTTSHQVRRRKRKPGNI
jgi:hypothetical protein